MREPIAPCKGCTDRVVEDPENGTRDCHRDCEKYKDYLERRRKWNRGVYKARVTDLIAGDRPWLHKHYTKEIRLRGRHND